MIHALPGEAPHGLDDIAGRRVDGVGRTEAAGELELRRREIDRDDPRGARDAGTLHDVQAHAPATDHRNGVGGTHPGDVAHGAEAGHHRATQDRGEVRRHVLRDGNDGPLVEQHALGQRADVGHRRDGSTVGHREPRQLIASATRCLGPCADVGLALLATGADAASHHQAGDHSIADRDGLDPVADGVHDAHGFVTEKERTAPVQHAVDEVEVAVAQADRFGAHEDLSAVRLLVLDGGEDELVVALVEDGSAHRRILALPGSPRSEAV